MGIACAPSLACTIGGMEEEIETPDPASSASQAPQAPAPEPAGKEPPGRATERLALVVALVAVILATMALMVAAQAGENHSHHRDVGRWSEWTLRHEEGGGCRGRECAPDRAAPLPTPCPFVGCESPYSAPAPGSPHRGSGGSEPSQDGVPGPSGRHR